jgi:hypothetical protein
MNQENRRKTLELLFQPEEKLLLLHIDGQAEFIEDIGL